ncbi:hypothetical protein HIM_04611 [Hirsutella minnesotensis 3608]|uniref:Uncharacterized protein n=1 Tax=Hirsutella minnesotensis 3608 TaxID=1043627 RepID=A0A0F7ZPV4_9HYPO|nr:hypothetical protein HIM_04611 [Hirsutella minnesotensis 3608]
MSLGRGDIEAKGYSESDRSPSSSQQGPSSFSGRWDRNGSRDDHASHYPQTRGASGVSGGSAPQTEYTVGDEALFTTMPHRKAQSMSNQQLPRSAYGHSEPDMPDARRPFHRTPTGLSVKQMRQAEKYEVDLEGGLDITFNAEVNSHDPAGITVPYRLLVPRLQYEYDPAEDDLAQKAESGGAGGFKRLLSFRKKSGASRGAEAEDDAESDEDEEYPIR